MPTKLLLMEDVEDLGRSGDIVTVKPGFARNFLLPQGVAVLADKRSLRLQARLQEERKKKAIVDRKESEEIAKKLEGQIFSIIVKVDDEENMYGSVSSGDIRKLIEDTFKLELLKKAVMLKHPIKEVGEHKIPIRLKEGIECLVQLHVVAEVVEGKEPKPKKEVKQEQNPS